MIDEHQKFPHKSNEKYFLQKEVVQTKPSNPKSSQAVNNLFIKSDQKHQKTISLHKITNSLLNKEVEMSEESFSKPANKSSIGLPLNSYQFNQIINEKKKAFNEKIPKTYRYTDLSKSPDIKPPLSERPQLCKSCKENEENMKKISLVLNNMIYEIASLNQIENLWRNGNLSFENERIGNL